MAGTIRATIDGRTYTASRNYHSLQHSGAPEEVFQFMPDFAERAFRQSGHTPQEVEGGDVTVVVDGTLVSLGMSKWPDSTIGSADQGGFGFGGLDAGIDVLNYGYRADRSFEVRRVGRSGGGEQWTLVVDGDVKLEADEFRPFQITWENGGNGGGIL